MAVQCAAKNKIDFDKVTACTKSPSGNQWQHLYAVQTDNLQPAHQYVPWVTVNGQHTEQMEAEAEKDLVRLICKTYKVIGKVMTRGSIRILFRAPIHQRHVTKTNEYFPVILFIRNQCNIFEIK